MPLKRLKNEYLEQDGVRFLMEDEEVSDASRGELSPRSLRPGLFIRFERRGPG